EGGPWTACRRRLARRLLARGLGRRHCRPHLVLARRRILGRAALADRGPGDAFDLGLPLCDQGRQLAHALLGALAGRQGIAQMCARVVALDARRLQLLRELAQLVHGLAPLLLGARGLVACAGQLACGLVERALELLRGRVLGVDDLAGRVRARLLGLALGLAELGHPDVALARRQRQLLLELFDLGPQRIALAGVDRDRDRRRRRRDFPP